MTVLSQDQSRQFLSSASAKDKYHVSKTECASPGLKLIFTATTQFFLRGTQLHQLTEEYEAIQANVTQMDDALRRKKQVLPELREAYIKAKNRAKEASAAISQQEKLEELKNDLVWSYVDEAEDNVRTGQQFFEKEKAHGKQYQKEIEAFEVRGLS